LVILGAASRGRLVALASHAGVDVEIGDPRRTFTVEPLEDPVPREVPSEPPREPSEEPAKPEKVEAD
jgi:hypothetical protein